MTEIIKETFDFNNIVSEIENANPYSSRKDIFEAIGKIITEIYYSKITEIGFRRKLDRFKKAKILIQRRRHPKDGKSIIDSKIQRDEKVSDYKKIRSILTGFSKYYAFNSAFYDVRDISKFNEYDSTQFMINGRTSLLLDDIDDPEHNGFKLKSEIEIGNVDRETENRNALFKEDIELEDQTVALEEMIIEEEIEIQKKIPIQLDFLSEISEPDNFYITTDRLNDLVMTSDDEINYLLESLKKSKYDKKLANYFSNYDNEIEDLTED